MFASRCAFFILMNKFKKRNQGGFMMRYMCDLFDQQEAANGQQSTINVNKFLENNIKLNGR